MSDFTVFCKVAQAHQFNTWLTKRGGIAVWPSVNLSNPDSVWYTPALKEDTTPYHSPTWQAAIEPSTVVTDPSLVGVAVYEEFRRFHVGLRRSSNGLSLKLTDGANRRLDAALMKAGPNATYYFDYETQEAVVLKATVVVPLPVWLAANPIPES